MKISVGIANLRSLRELQSIPIKPLTVFLGRNSSGKSTMLRSFPLIKQSSLLNSEAPILWYGRVVDFGDYATAVWGNDTTEDITFKFDLGDFSIGSQRQSTYIGEYGPSIKIDAASISFTIGTILNKTVLKNIVVSVPKLNIDMDITFDILGDYCKSLVIDGDNIFEQNDVIELVRLGGGLFSELQIEDKTDFTFLFTSRANFYEIQQKICRVLKGRLDKRLNDERLHLLATELLATPALDSSSLLTISNLTRVRSFSRFLQKIAKRPADSDYIKLSRLHKAYYGLSIFNGAMPILSSFYSTSLYIGPLRTRSERFYRLQEIRVSEIDTYGDNFSMFLGSLSPDDLESFSDWVQKIFGYGVNVRRSEGHISVLLRNGEHESNVVDAGFGVSQLLPILGQVWIAMRASSDFQIKDEDRRRTFVIIEQPELHLHPAHQALVADLMAETISPDDELWFPQSPVGFIVETHSEAMVNRIGHLVAAGRLKPGDVQMVTFSRDDDGNTAIRLSNFDESGSLLNWPYGFFNAGVEK